MRALFLLYSIAAQAALVRVEITERSAILGGKAFGKTGAYERLIGKAYFAVDPAAAANRDVVNLGLAPRNASGQVEFYADFVLFAPVDPKKSNGTLFFEVSNRGRKGLLAAFSHAQGSNDPRTAAEFGDGLLFEQGFTLAWLGWQFDVPREPPLMSVTVPVAKNTTEAGRAQNRRVEFKVTNPEVLDAERAKRHIAPKPAAPAKDATTK